MSDDPLWYEVPKSRKAPKQVQRALDEGAELVFAWGGDGTVQRCVDVLAGIGHAARDRARRDGEPSRDEPRTYPATSRPRCDVGLNGGRRAIDVGRLNGERFAVMAGAGSTRR